MKKYTEKVQVIQTNVRVHSVARLYNR